MSWQTIESKHILKTSFIGVREDLRTAPGFGQHSFYILEFPDWVNVVPVTKDQQLVLVRQFRHGLAAFNLEIPGGIVDPGESPQKTVVRELVEETGYVPETVELLSKVSVNPAIQDNWCHLFLATGCQLTQEQQLDGTEDIAVELVPLAQLPQLLAQGEIHHSLNCLALSLAWSKLIQ